MAPITVPGIGRDASGSTQAAREAMERIAGINNIFNENPFEMLQAPSHISGFSHQ
ncbi:hypothetical protein [Pseudosulfitobacter pseudonitzschiae]|uniref:hypothetical protein n=1 Tax=Pseudosulfitobacter pseudonitzschiae TaxID=1402135 RepID=UPI003B76A46F